MLRFSPLKPTHESLPRKASKLFFYILLTSKSPRNLWYYAYLRLPRVLKSLTPISYPILMPSVNQEMLQFVTHYSELCYRVGSCGNARSVAGMSSGSLSLFWGQVLLACISQIDFVTLNNISVTSVFCFKWTICLPLTCLLRQYTSPQTHLSKLQDYLTLTLSPVYSI